MNTNTNTNTDHLSELDRWARRWVWALPAWGALMGLSTVTHQPSARTEFAAYADYVTTPQFLVSHFGASLFGAVLGVVGAVALVILVITRGGGRAVLAGMIAFILGQTLTTAIVGVAAFFQPAIGDAYKGGESVTAPAIEAAVYGRNILITAGVGILALMAGAIMMARGARSGAGAPTWATRTFAIAMVAFPVTGQTIQVLQPIAGLALAVSTGAIAWTLVRRPTLDEGRRDLAPSSAPAAAVRT
jgi:hypothetical protein